MTEINQLEMPAHAANEDSATGSDYHPKGKKIVLTTFGSFGDIHPYIAVGLELKARGHTAIIATSPSYREKIEATGLGFHPVRPDITPPEENLETLVKAMDVMKGGQFIIEEMFAPHVHDGYKDLCEATRDADLLVTHMLTFAGPVVAEKT